ncbi:MAG TPA: helix-turn-helix domain-containing protein [Acidimicrobiales bacterium]|nr:helix-turn-helix domain-containing protein [Acidimicrobiales bacterium]
MTIPLEPVAGPATNDGAESAHRAMRSDAQRNHDRLVAAAREVFSLQGSDASMEAIALQAGVGAGTLYRHFPRRIDLVEAVYRNDVDELLLAAEKAVANFAPWEALVNWLDSFLRYSLGKRVFLTELREAFEKNPELRLSSREKVELSFTLVLENAQRAGVARTDIDGSDLMLLVGGMCTGPTLVKAQGERLLAMVIDGLRVTD